jgi:hypothetical protein
MLTQEDILQVMDERAQTVSPVTFPQYRPNAVTEGLKEFIVVSLPYSEVNKTLGEDDDWWLDMTVVFEIFVADRKTAQNPKEMNVPAMKRLRKALFGIFPIVDGRFKITRPRTVIPASSDGNGYHYTRIQAKMTTLV